MPRRKQRPRLWLHPDRQLYYILDSGRQIGTGCGPGDGEAADKALQSYLTAKHVPDWGSGDPSKVLIADVLASYAKEVAEGKPGAATVGHHLKPLLAMWGEDFAIAISANSCRDYHRKREAGELGRKVAPATAARELTTLRAAVNHAFAENRLNRQIPVPMLAKSAIRERWLQPGEAAALLWGALGWARQEDGHWKRVAPSRHYMARFILIALYTATRHEAVATLQWRANTVAGWIDVDAGVMHRRGTAVAESKKKRTPLPLPERIQLHAERWQRITKKGPIEWRGKIPHDVGDGFAVAAARAGFDDVTPHTLKHTSITWMMREGVPTWQVSQYSSTSEKTIRDVYGHHHPDHMREAVNAWGRNVGKSLAKEKKHAVG